MRVCVCACVYVYMSSLNSSSLTFSYHAEQTNVMMCETLIIVAVAAYN